MEARPGDSAPSRSALLPGIWQQRHNHHNYTATIRIYIFSAEGVVVEIVIFMNDMPVCLRAIIIIPGRFSPRASQPTLL
jgi:hypothetical protein